VANLTKLKKDISERLRRLEQKFQPTRRFEEPGTEEDEPPASPSNKISPTGSLVGSSSDAQATSWSGKGRKTFYANGRYWVFYGDGTNIVYRTSINGITWTDPTTVVACTLSHYFSIFFDGTYLHYANCFPGWVGQPMKYRRGLPNANGTITWSTGTEVTVYSHSQSGFQRPVIAVDTQGYPWIGCYDQYYNDLYATVMKSTTNDGTWSMASGFPDRYYSYHAAVPVPMTGTKMYIIYFRILSGWTWNIRGKYWNGSSLGDPEIPTSRLCSYGLLSVVNALDTVHLVFSESGTANIYHAKRDGTWTEQIISGAHGGNYLTLSVDPAKRLYLFWEDLPKIVYRKCIKNVWDSSDTELIDLDPLNPSCVNSVYKAYGYIIPVIWTKENGPYGVYLSGLI